MPMRQPQVYLIHKISICDGTPWWTTDEEWHQWGVTNIRDSQTVIQAWRVEHRNPEKQEQKEAPETMSLYEI